MATPESLAAFFSYVRQADVHDNGRITHLRERLEGELQRQGIKIEVFQDVSALNWGDRWKERVLSAVANSLLFIPVVTPEYFRSVECRNEYDAFKALEKRGIAGIILPIHYIDTDELTKPERREGNPWAEELVAWQQFDWRPLRWDAWESPGPNQRIEQIAKQLRQRLERLGIEAAPAADARTPTPSTPSVGNAADMSHDARPSVTRKAATAGASLPKRRAIVVDPHAVDVNDGERFRSISEAARMAKADDVLVVRPGTYRESVLIDKSVTLVGDGPRGAIVLEADSGHTLDFRAPFGRVVNMTIRRLKDEEGSCVMIRTGRLVLEDCDVMGGAVASIFITGDADPTIRRNRIHDSQRAGLFFFAEAKGTVEDNDVFGHPKAGIVINDDAGPQVRRNRIHGGNASGVWVFEKARGVIELNDIFDNARAGVLVQKDADPVVRDNRIYRNGHAAIVVEKAGRGTYQNNDLRNNHKGWDISADSREHVKQSGNIDK